MAAHKSGLGGKGTKKRETKSQIYDRLKKEFTAADLQKYTQNEPMIPARHWLAEMEAIYKEEMQKRKKRKA